MTLTLALLLLAPPSVTPPPPVVVLAATEMGSGCYRCRNRGERRLLHACRTPDQAVANEYRDWAAALAVGHPDIEVRMRAAAVLRACAACAPCGGRGWFDGYYQPRQCEACEGTGSDVLNRIYRIGKGRWAGRKRG